MERSRCRHGGGAADSSQRRLCDSSEAFLVVTGLASMSGMRGRKSQWSWVFSRNRVRPKESGVRLIRVPIFDHVESTAVRPKTVLIIDTA